MDVVARARRGYTRRACPRWTSTATRRRARARTSSERSLRSRGSATA